MRTAALALSLLFLVAACARQVHWTNPNPHANFTGDNYACTQEWRTAYALYYPISRWGPLLNAASQSGAQIQANRFFIRCMEARGWSATIDSSGSSSITVGAAAPETFDQARSKCWTNAADDAALKAQCSAVFGPSPAATLPEIR